MAQRNKVEVILSLLDQASKPFEQFNAKMASMTKPLQQINNRLVMLGKETGLGRVATQLGNVGNAASNVAGKLAMVGGAAVGAGFVFKRAFIDVAVEFERLETMMLSVEKTAEGTKRSLDWVKQFATETPLELSEATSAFIKLRTFGLDPTDGTMRALTDQMAKMGGGAHDLNGLILAVGQAWTKGKLQGEEALQLIERGVPVWDLLAKRTGKTAAQLQELATKGKLGRDVIRALVQEIGKASEGSSERMSRTWGGIISNLQDQWANFAKMVMDSGPFEILKGKLQGFLAKLDGMAKSGELAKIAEEWGKKISEAFEKIWTTGQKIYGFIKSFVDAVGGIENAMMILAAVAAGPLILSLVMLGQSFVMLGIAIAGPLMIAFASISKAFSLLMVTMQLTPLGWFLGAVGLIAGAAYLIYKNWEPIKNWFAELWADITAVFQKSIDFIVDKIDWISKKWQNTKDFFNIGTDATVGMSGQGNGYTTGGGFGGEWTPGPNANVMGATRQAVGGNTSTTQTNNAKVEIDFKNVPRGTDVKPARGNTAPLDLNMGYSGQW